MHMAFLHSGHTVTMISSVEMQEESVRSVTQQRHLLPSA